MQMRTFGGRGLVSVMGQGTWNMERDPRAEVVQSIRRGLDLGMGHVDTAELYGMGAVESIVAEAIAGRRDEVFLVSKVMPSHASYEGTLRACEKSLQRLKTDRLDCYLLHWPGSHPLEDTLRAFDTLAAEGKVLSYGVSNFDVGDLEEAVRIAGPGKIACNQVLYHLEEREIEHAVIPACEKHKVTVVGYSPFGSGRFPAPTTARGRVLDDIAKVRGATARQVALRFLARRKSVLLIPKASRAGHVEDNARAGKLELTDDDLRRIDNAFPLGPPRGELPTL